MTDQPNLAKLTLYYIILTVKSLNGINFED